MPTTESKVETGWTKQWPKVGDTFYWMRYCDGRYRDLPVHVDGIHVMCLFDHSYSQRGNIEGEVEFLGPISPSDFEQLTRLREALQEIADRDTLCNCEHDTEFCCAKVNHYCAFCIAATALNSEIAQRKEVKP